MTPRQKTNYLVVHCSATVDDGQKEDWTAIKNYHVRVNKWEDIGYHFGVEFINGKLTYKTGRPIGMVGSHCKDGGRNNDSIGICLIGNFDAKPPSEQQYYALARLCYRLCDVYGIHYYNIVPHNRYCKTKTCPGKTFSMKHLVEVIIKYRDYLRLKGDKVNAEIMGIV